MTDKEKKHVDVLLHEYRACHMNRDHYESVKWMIGSIFIAAIFTLLGLSFVEKIRYSPIEVAFLVTLSFLLMIIWLFVNEHVRWYVKASLERSYEIEETLRASSFDIGLHKTIRKRSQTSGRWVDIFLMVVVFGACIIRLHLVYDLFVHLYIIPFMGVCIVTICLVGYHMHEVNEFWLKTRKQRTSVTKQ